MSFLQGSQLDALLQLIVLDNNYRLNISPSSPHLKRRIWQETISTLFLTAQDCRIPSDQSMDFAQARDTEYPPYLLGFEGSPAERHVENLKVFDEFACCKFDHFVIIGSRSCVKLEANSMRRA